MKLNSFEILSKDERSVLSRRLLIASCLALSITAVTPVLSTWDDAYAAYLPSTKSSWNALDYGITGNGSTDDSAAINTFLTNANSAGASCWFPGNRTYELASSVINVPTGLSVVCSATATFRRSVDPGSAGSWSTTYGLYTGAMINITGSSDWTGGILNNTASLGASSSSNIVSVAAGKVFTVSAGLNIAVGNFIRIESTGTPSAHMEGTVTAYVGTSLTFNSQFIGPTAGSFTDWAIYAAAVYQCPIVLHGASKSNIRQIRVSGNWYVGLLADGWNPPAGGPLIAQYNTFNNCYIDGVQNRGIYTYGSCSDNIFTNCYINGLTNKTDYAFNMNPANASGTANSQQRNTITNLRITGVGFQGIAISDMCFYNAISNCSIISITASSGVGILIQKANGQIPQYNLITDCTITNVASAGIAFLGTIAAMGNGNFIGSCGIGLQVDASAGTNCAECSNLDSIINNCTIGISIAASQVNTIVSGRAYGNTTNFTNSGTGTVSSSLVLV